MSRLPERRGPWLKVSEREVYANAWFRVREDEVVRPNGAPGIYGVVESPPAVGVVAVGDAADLVLVGQYRYTTGVYSWEIPSGAVGVGESPLEAASRELSEEAGISASRWRELGCLQVANSQFDQLAYVFLAEGLEFGCATPDETEEIAVRQMSLGSIVSRVLDGEISQAFSVAALLLARHVLLEAGPGGVSV